MQWNVGEILDAATRGLRDEADLRDTEQAVYGVDILDELGLHPIVQRALRGGGFGVWPEQRYPSDRKPRRKQSEGQRCDVVLTPDGRPLVDPLAEKTLFGDHDAVVFEAAFWLEVKTVAQYTIDGPFARYSAELLSPVSRDIRKLARDRVIYHAGLLLILFTEDAATAEHDLAAWEQRCLRKGYPVAPPVARHTPITDRLGNAHMATAIFAVRRL